MPGYKPVYTEKSRKQLEDQSGKTISPVLFGVALMLFFVSNQLTEMSV